jgi:ADP-ribose pyrophosphatase
VDPDGGEHERVIVKPHGAVGVLALDEDDRVLLVEQYRHAVRRRLLEMPAGTLDVDGEDELETAQRELAEEADLTAASWDRSLGMFATPGYSSEPWTVFRATQLSPVPHEERTDRKAEEADMQQWWLPFDAAVEAVLAGRITDAMTVAGVLAEQVRRHRP